LAGLFYFLVNLQIFGHFFHIADAQTHMCGRDECRIKCFGKSGSAGGWAKPSLSHTVQIREWLDKGWSLGALT
jgi:hypothetical protein